MGKQINYTTILHDERKKLHLSMNEYALSSLIYNLASSPNNVHSGWCFASKETMAEYLDLSVRSVYDMIIRLINEGIVEKNNTSYLRTTSLWYNIVIESDHAETALQKPQSDTAETAVHIYTNNNIKDKIKRKTLSQTLIEEYNPVLCYKKKDQSCGKCGYCSWVILSPNQMYELAIKANVDYDDVKQTHDSLINLIKQGERKYKTVYLTVENWIRMGKSRGDIKELDFMGLEMLKLQHDPKLKKELDEARDKLKQVGKI